MIPAMGVIGHFLWEQLICQPITKTELVRPAHRHITKVTGGRLQVTGNWHLKKYFFPVTCYLRPVTCGSKPFRPSS
jgi:hypothetical protein